jgi:hypothetical protein
LRKLWAKACIAAGCPGRVPRDLDGPTLENLLDVGFLSEWR